MALSKSFTVQVKLELNISRMSLFSFAKLSKESCFFANNCLLKIPLNKEKKEKYIKKERPAFQFMDQCSCVHAFPYLFIFGHIILVLMK